MTEFDNDNFQLGTVPKTVPAWAFSNLTSSRHAQFEPNGIVKFALRLSSLCITHEVAHDPRHDLERSTIDVTQSVVTGHRSPVT